jgi:hypothetical protein
MIRFTLPRSLYRANCPPADSAIEVLLDVIPAAAVGLSCDAAGRGSPAGYAVMNVRDAVTFNAVRFTSIAVTPLGMLQAPFAPTAPITTV